MKQYEKTAIVNLTTSSVSTDGYLNVREWGQPMLLRFLPHPDFRGKLISVEWNTQDNVKHRITEEDEEFALFTQIGERPEINCPSSFFDDKGLPSTALVRIRFEFNTFRAERVWYGYLYLRKTYGDMQADTDAAYKIPRPKVASNYDCLCKTCACVTDCTHKH